MGNPLNSQINPYAPPSFADEFVDVKVVDEVVGSHEKLVLELRNRVRELEAENLELRRWVSGCGTVVMEGADIDG